MTDRPSVNVAALEKLLGTARDNALLRFSLGNHYLGQGDTGKAIEYLRSTVELDANYSAAWKLLGKAFERAGDTGLAQNAYKEGIETAQNKGDIQAAKEMQVFLNRLIASK